MSNAYSPGSGSAVVAGRPADSPIGTRGGLDATQILLGFARTLRHAGVAASPDRVQAMLRALDHLDVERSTDVYWAGRMTLCSDPVELDRYDAAFSAYFGLATVTAPARQAPEVVRMAGVSFETEAPTDQTSDADPVAARASRADVLRRRDIATLDPAERRELDRRELYVAMTRARDGVWVGVA